MRNHIQAIFIIGLVVVLAGCSANIDEGILPEVEYDGPELVSDDLNLTVVRPDSFYSSELVVNQSNPTRTFSASDVQNNHVEAAIARERVQVKIYERYGEQFKSEDSIEWDDFTISRSSTIDFERGIVYERWADDFLFTERSISKSGIQSRSIHPDLRLTSTTEYTQIQNSTVLNESLTRSLASEHLLVGNITFSKLTTKGPEGESVYASQGVNMIEEQFESNIEIRHTITDFYAILHIRNDGLISHFEWQIQFEEEEQVYVYETRIATHPHEERVAVPDWAERGSSRP